MRNLLLAAIPAFLILFTGCDGDGPGTSPEVKVTLPITVPEGFSVEVYADNLELPTSLAFAPDGSGRLFVNELQTGRIRIVTEDGPLAEPFAEVATHVSGGFPVAGENGLLGLAFDPDFRQNGYVYVTYAVRQADGTNLGAVARFTAKGNRGEDFTLLLDGIPAAPGHQIQSLAFGPDGKLYVSVGDAFRAERVNDPSEPLGKILRMNPDGTIPADNPFPGTRTYARGLRNSFDLAFDDEGRLFSADNGPSRNDELNRIEAGSHLGWPAYLGPSGSPDFIDPLFTWTEIVSPDGMVFYHGTQFPASYRGKLFVVLFGDTFAPGPSPRAKRIQTVDLTGEGTPVLEDFAVYRMPGIGNPLDVTEGPDGSLYFTDIFQGRVYRIRYDGAAAPGS
ncbi:PQQ-dependent sugar dehydrogenase [Rhodocaloribacter sp.]